MLNRWIENGLTAALDEEGIGYIVFYRSPKANSQAVTSKNIRADPARQGTVFLSRTRQSRRNWTRSPEDRPVAGANGHRMGIATARLLALLGASSVRQLEENFARSTGRSFPSRKLAEIESILGNESLAGRLPICIESASARDKVATVLGFDHPKVPLLSPDQKLATAIFLNDA